MKWSLVTLTLMFMGQFDLSEFNNNAPVFGPILFFTYMIIITMIMINLFVGIICDTMAAVGEEEEGEDEGGPPKDFIPALFNAVGNAKSKQSEYQISRIQFSLIVATNAVIDNQSGNQNGAP